MQDDINFTSICHRAVLGWNDASNNQFIISGLGSRTMNPPSIYAAALNQFPDMAKNLDHAPTPAGPEGRFRMASDWSLGIWKFSKNKELAKDLIRFLLDKDNYFAQTRASQGYNHPALADYQNQSIWREIPALNAYNPPLEQMHLVNYPGPPVGAARQSWLLYITPIMFSKVITGTPVDEAIKWAEGELKRIYKQ